MTHELGRWMLGVGRWMFSLLPAPVDANMRNWVCSWLNLPLHLVL